VVAVWCPHGGFQIAVQAWDLNLNAADATSNKVWLRYCNIPNDNYGAIALWDGPGLPPGSSTPYFPGEPVLCAVNFNDPEGIGNIVFHLKVVLEDGSDQEVPGGGFGCGACPSGHFCPWPQTTSITCYCNGTPNAYGRSYAHSDDPREAPDFAGFNIYRGWSDVLGAPYLCQDYEMAVGGQLYHQLYEAPGYDSNYTQYNVILP